MCVCGMCTCTQVPAETRRGLNLALGSRTKLESSVGAYEFLTVLPFLCSYNATVLHP